MKKQIRNIGKDIERQISTPKIFGDINDDISGARYEFFFENIRRKVELTLRDNLCDAIYEENQR